MSTRRADRFITLLIALWAGLYVWSFVSFSITEATGSGFTRGFNRITGFLTWQLAAGFVAIPVFAAGRRLERGTALRRASRLPLALAVALVVGIAVLIAWARLAV